MALNPQQQVNVTAFAEQQARLAVIRALVETLTPDDRETFTEHLRHLRQRLIDHMGQSTATLEEVASFEALFDIAVDAMAGPPPAPV